MGPATPASTTPPIPDIMQDILTGVYDVSELRSVFYGPYGFHKAPVINDASKVSLSLVRKSASG